MILLKNNFPPNIVHTKCITFTVVHSTFFSVNRIPQLLTCLVRSEGRLIMNLLSQVGRMYPQAVYFPIRTLYLTLKIEQRERCKSQSWAVTADLQQIAVNRVERDNVWPNILLPANLKGNNWLTAVMLRPCIFHTHTGMWIKFHFQQIKSPIII